MSELESRLRAELRSDHYALDLPSGAVLASSTAGCAVMPEPGGGLPSRPRVSW